MPDDDKRMSKSEVAIPLKRGKSSTIDFEDDTVEVTRRNPLEAGQKFNYRNYEGKTDLLGVAIPLKRGKSSTDARLGSSNRAVKSQSP